MTNSQTALTVMHVHAVLDPGGIGYWLARLPQYMPAHVQLVYCLTDRPGVLYDGVRSQGVEVIVTHHATRSWVPDTVARIAALRRALRDVRPGIVHAHQDGPIALTALAMRLNRMRAPLVAHYHSVPLLRPESIAGRLQIMAMRQAASATYVSRTVLESHVAHYGCRPPNASVDYLGVPLDAMDRMPKRGEARAKLGVAPDVTAVLFVGRLTTHTKGLDVLLSSIAQLASVRDDFIILVAGAGPDEGSLRAMAAELAIEARLQWLGYRSWPDILGVYAAADALVLPSRREGLGLVNLEAMACGVPVVATQVGGIPEAVVEGETGLLVPPEDVDGLAVALTWMMDHPDERAAMGAAGRAVVRDRFSMRQCVAALADRYAALAGAARGATK